MAGKSEFKVKINRRAIADIVSQGNALPLNQAVMTLIQSGAPFEDVKMAMALLSFEQYLKERNCEPDFEVVLHE